MEYGELTAFACVIGCFAYLIRYLTTDLVSSISELKDTVSNSNQELKDIVVKLIDKIGSLVDTVNQKWKA